MTENAKAPAPKVFYFGCLDSGHHMYEPGDLCYLRELETPWGDAVDGDLCPQDTYENGLAVMHHKDGWTAMSFRDQSQDTRPGSHSTFLVRGDYNFDQMYALAKAQWSGVFDRIGFSITEWK